LGEKCLSEKPGSDDDVFRARDSLWFFRKSRRGSGGGSKQMVFKRERDLVSG